MLMSFIISWIVLVSEKKWILRSICCLSVMTVRLSICYAIEAHKAQVHFVITIIFQGIDFMSLFHAVCIFIGASAMEAWMSRRFDGCLLWECECLNSHWISCFWVKWKMQLARRIQFWRESVFKWRKKPFIIKAEFLIKFQLINAIVVLCMTFLACWLTLMENVYKLFVQQFKWKLEYIAFLSLFRSA